MIKKIFREIVDQSFEGIIIISEDYRIKYMNHYAGKITGFSNQEALNRHCYEILRAQRCKDFCPIKAIKNNKGREEIIIDIIAKDNSEKYIKAKVIQSNGYWVEIFHDITREIQLEKRMKGKYIFQDIITQDKGLIDILDQFPIIAASQVPVLFEGESGVGKEVFSSALQNLSDRRDQPFVKLNCAALPDTLLESELFGYKKGAFTDARKDKPGLFEMANKGTLFLDEIGEMSLALQAKLLRVVETGEVIPLGATQSIKSNVRLLAATNKDLSEEVSKGNFREDLFYRLNVVNIRIPSLRERKNDIILFIEHFIHQFNILQNKKITGISDEAMKILFNHSYPGNIRELKNIMEYAYIFCSSGDILPKHLPKYLVLPSTISEIQTASNHQKSPSSLIPGKEKQEILEALQKARWNKKKAAALLKIDRTTLWRKIKKYNI